MIPFLNEVGDIWFDFAKLFVIQNSIFLGLVFLALFLLKNASAQVKYWITCIGLLKLVLPPFITVPFIKSPSADVVVPAVTNPVEQLVVVFQSFVQDIFLSNTAVLFSIWMILASLILLLFLFSTFRLKLRLRNSIFLQMIDSVKKYKIFQSKYISMPLTVGLFPKKIFVPEKWQKWSSDCKKMILSHEIAHIKRHDGLVQFIQIIVQAIYFFHPLVWILNKFMNKYREMACDDFAVSSSKGSSFEYSKYLTEIAEKMVSNRYKFVFVSAIFRIKFELLSRIQYQMKEVTMKRISKTKLSVIVVGLLLFILPLSLTSSQQRIDTKSEKVSQEKQKKKSLGEVVSKLFPLPEGGLKAIQKNVVYPDEAKRLGLEGKVVVKANVNTNGDVEKVSVLEGIVWDSKSREDKSPISNDRITKLFTQAAIDAVKKAKWSKSSIAELKDSEAGFEFKIPVVFSLDKKGQDVKPRSIGKVRGKITDKKTGKTLIGVDVLLEGTGKGAATDINGEFFIVNVREGIYSLKVSSVGYKTVKMDKIRVSSGLTTNVDFALEQVVVKLNESKKVIKKGVKIKAIEPGEPIYVPYSEPPEPIGGMKAIYNNLKLSKKMVNKITGGKITVNVLISEQGDIIDTKVEKSQSVFIIEDGILWTPGSKKNPDDDKWKPEYYGSKKAEKCYDSVIDAIKSVRWKPAKQRNKPVQVWIEVPVEFKVKKS